MMLLVIRPSVGDFHSAIIPLMLTVAPSSWRAAKLAWRNPMSVNPALATPIASTRDISKYVEEFSGVRYK